MSMYAAAGYQWWQQQTAATTNNINIWPQSSAVGFYPSARPAVLHSGQTDWERAAVKAEPDDEFSWLRKRVREIEELAFA